MDVVTTSDFRSRVSPSDRDPHLFDPLSDETLQKVKNFVLEREALIQERMAQEGITFYKSTNCIVFEATAFPGLIIKIMNEKESNKQLRAIEYAQRIVEREHLHHCMVPRTAVIVKNNVYYTQRGIEKSFVESLLIMEKARGVTNSYESVEISERAFTQFTKDSEMQEKWSSFFVEATRFIALTNYWDTGWANIILDEEKGFSFIDFEGTGEPAEAGESGPITALLNMAPPEFFDLIIKTASEYDLSPSHSWDPEKRILELEMRKEIRTWHERKGITSVRNEIVEGFFEEGSLESRIIRELNQLLVDQDDSSDCLILRRRIVMRLEDKFKGVSESEFIKALEALKARDAICLWRKESRDFYTIYF